MASTSNAIGSYFDHLIESHEIVGAAMVRANDRGARLAKQFMTTVIEGQRAGLRFGQKLADGPADAGHVYELVSAGINDGRERYARFGEAVQKEFVAGRGDLQESFGKWQTASRATMKAGTEAIQDMVATTPIGDGFSQLRETFGNSFGQTVVSEPAAAPQAAPSRRSRRTAKRSRKA